MKPVFFKTPAEFRAWLNKHHRTATELIVGYYKKGSGKPSLTWQESVDEALCFGWIDGIRRSYGEDAYTNRFTPRRKGSNWSAINIQRVAELTKAGRMQPAGLEAFARRTETRSRVYTYERKEKDLPRFEAKLEKLFKANKQAWAFFLTLPPYYRRGETRWVNSAKAEETKRRRLNKVIAACQDRRRR
jgi:uncharacterized protein YdeI (YjbR/CyaY-like superfamily)